MGYVGLALISGVLLGMWQFGIGLYRRRVSRFTVILVSGGIAGIAYVVIGAVTGALVFDLDDVPEGIVGGIFNVTGTLLLLKAYECGKVGVASGIAATCALVPLAYSVVLGEPLTGVTGAGTLVLLVGLAMFYGAHLREGGDAPDSSSRASILFALGTALFWGLAVVVLDYGSLVSVTGALAMSEVPQVAITLFIIVTAGIRVSFAGIALSVTGVLVSAGIALALSNFLFYVAANMGDIGVASVLGSLSAVVPAVLAFIFFRERMVKLEQAALIVVLLGTSLVFLG